MTIISLNIKDLKLGAVVASIVLFAPASVFLGMVSPYAVRLRLEDVKHSGATVGKLYAISTLGSITGTFLAGFFLIPTFGHASILYGLTFCLFILSFIAYPLKSLKFISGAVAFFIVAFSFNHYARAMSLPEGLTDIDTEYNRVWIYNENDYYSGQPVKKMQLNKSSSSAMFLHDEIALVYPYAKFYELGRHFVPDLKSTLMIGGAAYSYPKYFIDKYPEESTMDVVEIDPDLTEIAREYFFLKDSPRLNIYHEDGRTFIKNSKNKYDVIYGDAYQAYYSVPFHLTTREAIQEISDAMTENGVFILNSISAIEGEKSAFLRAEVRTMKEIFPHVLVFPVQYPDSPQNVQNVMIIGLKNPDQPNLEGQDAELKQLLQNLWTTEIPADLPVLTDDFAPVDSYVQKML